VCLPSKFTQKEGRQERNEEIAKNAFAEGASVEFVRKITDLDIETVKRIQISSEQRTKSN
jgi:predicted transposase YdaD